MTRFLIAKQVGSDAYRTIAGLCDGYLEHTGSILLTHYNSPEIVDRLLDLRDSVDRVINAVPPKIVSAPQRRYYDANQKEILADMHIRFPNGTMEKVYATQDTEGNPDLGINASNDAYMRRHGKSE